MEIGICTFADVSTHPLTKETIEKAYNERQAKLFIYAL